MQGKIVRSRNKTNFYFPMKEKENKMKTQPVSVRRVPPSVVHLMMVRVVPEAVVFSFYFLSFSFGNLFCYVTVQFFPTHRKQKPGSSLFIKDACRGGRILPYKRTRARGTGRIRQLYLVLVAYLSRVDCNLFFGKVFRGSYIPILVWYTPVFRGSYTYGRVVYSKLLPCFEVNRVCVVLVSTTLLKIIYYVGLAILQLGLIFLIFFSEICSYHSPRKLDRK